MENEEKSQAEQENKSQSVWKDLWDYAKIILVVFVIAFLLGHFVYINARVPSGSMEQTIMTGDRGFGNRLAYKTKDPERFDIVIFKNPPYHNMDSQLSKEIRGLHNLHLSFL